MSFALLNRLTAKPGQCQRVVEILLESGKLFERASTYITGFIRTIDAQVGQKGWDKTDWGHSPRRHSSPLALQSASSVLNLIDQSA